MSTGREQDQLPRAFGPYTLLKLLARGGMGEIYLARTTGLADFEKYYAVKKLLAKYVRDNDVTTRFMDEAKLGARLGHPNIVQVYDLGRINDELYMAAEFVDGFDLRRILRFCHEKTKRIPLDIALFIVREILSGLAYAHRQVDAQGRPINLVHRDISPQNVLVSFEGEVKIIDFGLAKSTQRSQETQANVLLGNFGYMSPEQARGKKLDVRTDVYSTGIVMFELLTGTKRFVDDNPLSLLEKVASPAPVMPSEKVPGTPVEVDRIFAKATNPNWEERFPDAEVFRDELTRVLFAINPRASRELLAEFLNHLFLGGAAPKSPTQDPAQARALLDRAAAPVAAADKGEGFAEDARQTESIRVMRDAQTGDLVPESELVASTHTPAAGTPAVRPPSPSRGPAPKTTPPPAPVPTDPPTLDAALLTPIEEASGPPPPPDDTGVDRPVPPPTTASFLAPPRHMSAPLPPLRPPSSASLPAVAGPPPPARPPPGRSPVGATPVPGQSGPSRSAPGAMPVPTGTNPFASPLPRAGLSPPPTGPRPAPMRQPPAAPDQSMPTEELAVPRGPEPPPVTRWTVSSPTAPAPLPVPAHPDLPEVDAEPLAVVGVVLEDAAPPRAPSPEPFHDPSRAPPRPALPQAIPFPSPPGGPNLFIPTGAPPPAGSSRLNPVDRDDNTANGPPPVRPPMLPGMRPGAPAPSGHTQPVPRPGSRPPPPPGRKDG